MGNVRMRAEQINYGASNVKVALDDLDPKDLIALSARMDTIEAWKATVKAEEKTGASVEFTNALALPAVSVSAEIEAIQDLHGYDKPWVGGAGKNLLPMTVAGIKAANTRGTWSGNVYTDTSGVVFTILTDNADNVIGIKANGTPANLDARLSLTDSFPAVSGTTYTINGSPSGVSGSTYRIFPTSSVAFGVGNRLSDDTSWDATRTAAGNESVEFFIQIVVGVAADNLIFYPMIRLASVADATFAPYENICPITGYSSVTITNVDSESHTATVTVSLGSTVYGGTLNLTTGELTITHVLFTVSNDGNWSVASTNVYQHTQLDGAKTGATTYTNAISSCFNEQRTGMSSMTNGGFKIQDAYLYVKATDYSTVSDFVTAFAGQTVLYELATPTTTTLTAAQLEMVKGYNHISANSGNITVKAYTGAPWGGDTI